MQKIQQLVLSLLVILTVACQQAPLDIQPTVDRLDAVQAGGVVQGVLPLWNSAQQVSLWSYVSGLSFSPDGKYLVGLAYREAILWNVETRRQVSRKSIAGNKVLWSPDGNSILIDSTIFDRELSPIINLQLSQDQRLISIRKWSGDGSKVLGTIHTSGNNADQLVIWDANTGTIIKEVITGNFTFVDWSNDDLKIAVVSNYYYNAGSFYSIYVTKFQVINVEDGQILLEKSRETYNISDWYWYGDIRFSNNSNQLAVKDPFYGIDIFDLNTKLETNYISVGRSSYFEWSKNDNYLVSIDRWNDIVSSYDIINKTNIFSKRFYSASNLATKPNSNIFVFSYIATSPVSMPELAFLDASSGNVNFLLNSNNSDFTTPHKSNVYNIAFQPNKSIVATASRDGRVVIRNSETGTSVTGFAPHAGSVYAEAWSPDGTQVATGGEDGQIRIWHYDANIPKDADLPLDMTLSGHTYTVRNLAWSPDGSRLASASWDSTVRIWNPVTGEEVSTYAEHTDFVHTVAWNKTGTRIASGAGDGIVKVWNPTDGQTQLTLTGHVGAVHALAWNPDNTLIATAGADKTIRIWDTQTGQTIKTIEAARGTIRALNWLPDGTGLFSAGDDGIVRFWNLSDGMQAYKFSPESGPIFSLGLANNGITLVVGNANGSLSAVTLQR
jgi:WD40 repeat protein